MEIPTDGMRDGSLFMRPFAIGMTAYLATYNLLYMLTRGKFHSPDLLAEMYFVVLAAYSGAPEIKRLAIQPTPTDPEGWEERIRKGGPLITLWFLLWSVAVTWRIYDPTIPMPAELRKITMGVIGLFLGTYALRQYRKRVGRRVVQPSSIPGVDLGQEGEFDPFRDKILNFLEEKGPSTPKTIRESLDVPRRTLTRLLTELAEQGEILRENKPPTDPSATYRLK
jgi:hypothetical protein